MSRRHILSLFFLFYCLTGYAVPLLRPKSEIHRPRTVFDTLTIGDANEVLKPSEFEIFNYLIGVTGLHDALDDALEHVTVFAPTDTAFINLAKDFGYRGSDKTIAFQILSNVIAAAVPETIQNTVISVLVGYHISPIRISANDLFLRSEVPTVIGDAIQRSKGNPLELVGKSQHFPSSNLVAGKFDVSTSNGVVHVIDRVLLPFNVDPKNPEKAFSPYEQKSTQEASAEV